MAMRITNSMIYGRFLNNLNGSLNRLTKASYQLETGYKIKLLSEDPVGIIKSMQARVRLNRLEQHTENVSMGKDWLTQAETCARDINDIIKLALENDTLMSNDTYSPSDREKSAQLIKQIRDHVLEVGNNAFSDRYIFGGYNTTQKPFTVVGGDIYYNGYSMTDLTPPNDADLARIGGEAISFEIAFETKMEVTISGTYLMGTGEDNVYKILDDLYNTLVDPSSTAQDISPYLTKLQGAQDRVLAVAADLGARMNSLDLFSYRYAEDKVTYTDIKSRVEDADAEEAAMNLAMAKLVYQSALSSGAQIMQLTLLNYLN